MTDCAGHGTGKHIERVTVDHAALLAEIEQLRARLEEAEQTLKAIRSGDVDAIVISGPEGEQIFSLSSAETVYRRVFETMAEAALSITPDGGILFCNARFAELVETPMEKLLGRDFADWVWPEERDEFQALLRQCEQQPVKQRVVFRAASSALKAAHVTGHPLMQPGGLTLCLVATELTELENSARHVTLLQKQQRALKARQVELQESRLTALRLMEEAEQAAAALRESEERLRFVLETSHTGAWDLNLEDHTAYRSLEHDRIFGYDHLLPRWTYEMFLEHVLAEDRTAVDEQFRWAIASHTDWRFECQIRRVDSEVRWIWAAGRHREQVSGGSRRMAGIIQDITERKRAEAALLQSREMLQEADRRKDEFLATLAHELRNPLAPIRTALQVLQRTVDPDPTTERLLAMMDRQITHLGRLVDDLLEVSRITRGKIELRKERSDIATLIGHALDTSRALIEASDHKLEVSLPPEPLLIEADPVRLTQVFANLLNNATKYMEPGGAIRLAAQRDGNEIRVSVRDTGDGIAPELLPRVFDLFTQTDRSFHRAQGGLGIGLALVHHLVKMHAGTVTARSEGPGQGSEFVVCLPVLAEPPKARKRPERSTLSTPVAVRRILIVDDNRDAADSLAALLVLAGHETRVAYGGEEGIAVAARFRPEVILLDLGMPTMDGYETCRHLREQPWGREVTVVALTGWGQDEDRCKARAAGFDAHLVKPGNYDELMALIADRPADMKQPSASH